MKAFNRILIMLLAGALLAGCGGGGGPGDDSGFNPPGVTVNVTATNTTIGVLSTTDLTVTVTTPGGAPAPNGTQVSAAAAPASLGQFSVDNGPLTPTALTTTSGGQAQIRFHSGNTPGTASVTISVQDPATPGRTVTRTIAITISGASTDQRLTLQATRTTLPANIFNVPPFVGSPYMAEVTVTWRNSAGQLINDGSVNVTVNPVGSTGGFSTLDDPETDDVNEFFVRLGQGPVDIVAGKATLFFHSISLAGTSTMTVTAVDPDNGQNLSATLQFTVNNIAPPLPAQVLLSAPDFPVYVQGAGGNTTLQIEVDVRDGAGGLIPDPVVGNNAFNNVRLEIIGDGPGFGERLTGINAQGQSVSGTSISVRTINGIAGAIFESGTRIGTTSIRATVDRADNNVDNGIQSSLTADRSISVSDGRLFSLTLTSPIQRAIFPGTLPCAVCEAEDVGPTPGFEPPEQAAYDGTYSLTVSVVATDRGGNPVLPGTNVGFGLIDEPQGNFLFAGSGDFLLSGLDGNPQESGFLFNAPGGAFQTAGGGAGPGDTLVLFGKAIQGNADHESARTVQQIDSQTQLRVSQRFNPNDTTGVSVNSGPVLPYVIGRAQDGNIETPASTDVRGVAFTRMNYPVSRLGKRVIIWAQGIGVPTASGGQRTVADAALAAFPGIAPITLTASPSKIPGNATTQVLLCVQDALNSPIRGVSIEFGFELGAGTGSVDGVEGAGFVANPTDVDGCTVATVTTAGILSDTDDALLIFNAGPARAEVEILVGEQILQALPSSVLGSGTWRIELRLLSASGQPIDGVQLVGTCEASGGSLGITSGPGITGQTWPQAGTPPPGTTSAFVSANLDGIGSVGTGTCTFTTATGEPEAEVNFTGIDVCTSNFSPIPPGCPGADQEFQLTVLMRGEPGDALFAVASSLPAGVNCAIAGTDTMTCGAMFQQGSFVTVLIGEGANTEVDGFSGQCTQNGPTSASVQMGGDRQCIVELNQTP